MCGTINSNPQPTTPSVYFEYRPHRRTLDEAMAEKIGLNSYEELLQHLRKTEEGIWTESDVKIEPYGYDSRIHWNTHMVSLCDFPLGCTDGPVDIQENNTWHFIDGLSGISICELSMERAFPQHFVHYCKVTMLTKKLEWAKIVEAKKCAPHWKWCQECLNRFHFLPKNWINIQVTNKL